MEYPWILQPRAAWFSRCPRHSVHSSSASRFCDFSRVCLLFSLMSRLRSVLVYLWYSPVTLGCSGSPRPLREPYSKRLYSSGE